MGITDRLASPCVNANTGNANWNLFIVPSGYVTNNNVWNSNNGSNSNTYGVRPADSKKTVVGLCQVWCVKFFIFFIIGSVVYIISYYLFNLLNLSKILSINASTSIVLSSVIVLKKAGLQQFIISI